MTAKILERIAEAESLPALPRVVIDILELTRDPDSSAEDIAQTLQHDPALAARVLHVVNSSLFGLPRSVASIRQAVSMLGMRTVRVLALSFSLVEVMRQTDEAGFDFDEFWRRSLSTAVASRGVANAIDPKRRDEAFVAGLLSQLGLLAGQISAPDLMRPLLERWDSSGVWRVEDEVELLGVTRADMGRALLDRWDLPEYLCAAVGAALDPSTLDEDDPGRPLASILAAGFALASVFCGDAPAVSIEELRRELVESTNLDYDGFDEIGAALPQQVTEAGAMLSLSVGMIGSWEDIRRRATVELAQLAMEAEADRRAAELREEAATREAATLRREKKEILELASTDGLTGVANRVEFDRRLDEAMSRAAATRSALSLVLLDIDHFKLFNDTHGHRIGDLVLREVAQRIEKSVDSRGFVARYGGEEFAILLGTTESIEAVKVAEAIRLAIAGSPVDAEGQPLFVTASLGVATRRATPPVDLACVEALIDAADAALYRAKAEGRDRVIIAPHRSAA